jgi:rod shape-determining protein MreD
VRRFVVISLLILTAVLLQTTVFAPRYVSLFGVSPDLVIVVVISLGLLEGPAAGAVSGFGGGLLRDFLINAPKGITGLSYLLVGYVTASIRPYIQSTSILLPVAGIFAGSIAGTAIYDVVSALLGVSTQPIGRVLLEIVLTAVYNTLLAPFVYPLVRRVAAASRTQKVYKW